MNEFLRGILEGINSFVGNYGWSIVLFTLLIRVIILPFDYKSRVSMRKTQKIQPKINALQKRYANDRDKLNQKMNELYQKERINPLSSCLPMLLTMPILFAMFAAMRMVANEQIVKQVMDMLNGNVPTLEGWFWIKNIWMPDSPFAGCWPDLNMLRQVTADIWQKTVTGDQLAWLIDRCNLAADPFSNANLQATITAINAALQELPAYVENTGVMGHWTFNFLIAQFSIMKDWNGLFILPIAAAVSQLLMTKLQPTQPQSTEKDRLGNDKNPNPNSGFMTWFFPIFSLWICASSNGAFALYWMAANIIAIVETWGINKYLDMKEAKESNIVEEDGLK